MDWIKPIIIILFAAVVSLIAWNIKTTNDLQIKITRMEVILQNIAMEN